MQKPAFDELAEDPRLDPNYEHSLVAQLPGAGAIVALCLVLASVLLVL